MPTDTPYSIADLARLTGVNVRTIRYYLAQGLLPASGESGPGAHYGEGHLDRLRLTKRLQEQHLPLAEIRVRLADLTDQDVASGLAITNAPEPGPASSALEYVRSVLGAPPSPSATRSRVPAQAAGRAVAPALATRTSPPRLDAANFIKSARLAMPPTTVESIVEAGPPQRSQWERLSLGPNVELNIRRPLSRIEQRRVERLITIARQVLKEDMK